MNSITIPVGIDVSKDTLDVFIDRVSGRKRMKVSNDEEGVRQILCELEVGTYKVAMEATGRYEVLARRMLEEAGLAVSSLNPRLARHMAIGFGVKATTGRVMVTWDWLSDWVRLPPMDSEPQPNFCWKLTRLSMFETASTGSTALREITEELVA